ncbi:MAG: FAD-binding oxidoreductase [Candidatus Binatia bacterium]|nr:FAD-binding oxidoreductase [Candidatus Binatia bacterium]
MHSVDVVIVGAGFAGAATAFHLTRRGVRRVVVLEREAIPGYHASGRNAALGFTSIDEPEAAALARAGLAFIREEASALAGRSIFRPCGSLLVAGESSTAARLQAMARTKGMGFAWWDRNAAVAAVPVLEGAEICGALWSADDGVVDIHALLQVYLREARSFGAEIVYNAPVERIEVRHNRVVAVHTRAGSWGCGVLVDAAGAWASEVARLAGSPMPTLEPRRRHLFLGQTSTPINSQWPFVWHADVDTYFRPEGAGLLLSPCDATPHPAAEPAIDDSAKVLLAEKLTRAFPRLAELALVSAWACLRTFAADERFVIGPDPAIGGFVWVAGLGGHGMTTSAAVGRLAASAVLGEAADELSWFRPERLLR